MIIRIDEAFRKDTKRIKNALLLRQLASVIESVIEAKKISEISNLKKLKGAQNHYRIRVGDYRAGIIIEEQTVTFIRFLHRKDVYKSFP